MSRTEGILDLQHRAFTVIFQSQNNGFQGLHIQHNLGYQVSITEFTQEGHQLQLMHPLLFTG